MVTFAELNAALDSEDSADFHVICALGEAADNVANATE